MRSNITPWLKLAIAATVLSSQIALLTTLRYSPNFIGATIVALIFMPWGERMDRATPWYQGFTGFLTLLFILSEFVILETSGFLDAVIALVIYVQLYCLVHDKAVRHYNYLLLMAFFLVLGSSLMSPSAFIGLVFFMLVIAALWTLILLEMYEAAGEQGEVYLPGTFDAEARNGTIGDKQPSLFDARFMIWLVGIALVAIAGTTVLFVVTPRTEAGLLASNDVFRRSEQFTTGISSEVDLTAGGTIQQDRTAVMRVKFPEIEGGQYGGELFWRVTTFDDFTGSGWARRGLDTTTFIWQKRDRGFAAIPRGNRGSSEGVYRTGIDLDEHVVQEIYIDQLAPEGLPVLSLPILARPSEKDIESTWRWDTAGDFTVHANTSNNSSLRYEVWSSPRIASPKQLRDSKGDYLSVMKQSDYQNLTTQNLLPETLSLVQELTADLQNPYDKLVAIERYLTSSDYSYTLDLPPLPPENPIDAFVHDTKTGHCELYASAMALMARSVGIPCRVVSGYRGGVWSESGEAYTISADMSHLWVEVYFPDYGWITFDPSPVTDDFEGISISNLMRAYSRFTLRLRLFWESNVVGFQSENRWELIKDKAKELLAGTPQDDTDESTTGNGPKSSSTTRRYLAPVTIGVLVVIALPLLLVAVRRWLNARRREKALSSDQIRAIRLYQLLGKNLQRTGFAREGETAEEILHNVHDLPAEQFAPIAQILHLYNSVRFGVGELTPADYATLRQQIRALKVGEH